MRNFSKEFASGLIGEDETEESFGRLGVFEKRLLAGDQRVILQVENRVS